MSAQSMRSGPGRLARWEATSERRLVNFFLDDEQLQGYAGESVAAALLAARVMAVRESPRLHAPRGPYCGIGVCCECVATVDGRPNVKTCLTALEQGMRVTSQPAAPHRPGHQDTPTSTPHAALGDGTAPSSGPERPADTR